MSKKYVRIHCLNWATTQSYILDMDDVQVFNYKLKTYDMILIWFITEIAFLDKDDGEILHGCWIIYSPTIWFTKEL